MVKTAGLPVWPGLDSGRLTHIDALNFLLPKEVRDPNTRHLKRLDDSL